MYHNFVQTICPFHSESDGSETKSASNAPPLLQVTLTYPR